MANRKKTDESCRSLSTNSKRHDTGEISSSSSSNDEYEVTRANRSGCRNPSPEHYARNRVKTEQTTGQTTSRRDADPLSFKVFLKNLEAQTNYHNTGARPKVYTSPTLSPSSIEKDSRVYSRNPTELPDFVQDHLVIEQCYLNHESGQQLLPDVDNLPDFALNSMEQRQSRLRNETKKNGSNDCNLPFDLTGTLDKGLTDRDHSVSSAIHANHLDLPTFNRPIAETAHHPESQPRFPFDLPLPFPESFPNVNISTGNGPLGAEANIHKSLPDFLSDGPIHNRTTLSTDAEPTSSMAESMERRLLLENERLRHELEIARRQVSEKTERIHSLESELLSRREVEHEETAHLEKAMEQVEDNLKRSTKRAVTAESTVTSLKKEIKNLRTEIYLLQVENGELRAGISTGQSELNTAVNANRTIRRLTRDLFTAASTAETSLRQLMSGVDNLRVLASTLENLDRIEDWTKDFLPDSDEDNAAGPAV